MRAPLPCHANELDLKVLEPAWSVGLQRDVLGRAVVLR
jgi:hypothetical protein